MSEIDILAHIIAGEATGCPFAAMLAVAWLYGTGANRTFYGWDTPDDYHWFIAYAWWLFPNPAPGARYLFSASDLRLPAVQRIVDGRGPPVVFECKGGLSLWAY